MREAMTNTGMKIKLTDTCLYEGVVRGGDMVFLENCRMIGKRETIMLQMADLTGSDHQQPLDDILNIHGHKTTERELVEEVPEKGTDNRRDGDACECAEERGCKEVERPGTNKGYPCEGEVHTLLLVRIKDV